MAAMDPRWGDDDDDDSAHEEIIVEDDIDLPAPGTGHRYEFPFTLGHITVNTYGDFISNKQDLYDLFISTIGLSNAEDIWADYAEGMISVHDPGYMDETSWCFATLLNDVEIDVDAIRAGLAELAGEHQVQDILNQEAIAQLQATAAEFSLDVFEDQPRGVRFSVPQPKRNVSVKLSANENDPPLAPIAPESKIVGVRLAPATKGAPSITHDRVPWRDFMTRYDPSFPTSAIDDYHDAATVSTSRSRTRPIGRGSVSVIYQDGTSVNVGAHGYRLLEPAFFPMNLDNSSLALEEFFAAPGGEGLTTATPSHLLHQMISALFSMSLGSGVEVENDKIDIVVPWPGRQDMLNIDITSSAGIFNKKLAPDRYNPDYRTQAAVSKYDLASLFAQDIGGKIADLLVRASANCLACEFPAHYRIHELDVDQDLLLQSEIYNMISGLSVSKLQELKEICYESAVAESLDLIRGVDVNAEGKPWRDKRDELLAAARSLKPRNKIAFPPIPLGEIQALPPRLSIVIQGEHFVASASEIQGRSLGPRVKVPDIRNFRENFPADGRIDYDEALELANILDDARIPARGLTHRGPCDDYSGMTAEICKIAGSVYSQSAGAQFAEIRADLVRAVCKNPIPGPGVWQQVFLYKSKVCAWYSSRDNPNSPDGFRIDWFAVSSFPVAGSVLIDDGNKGTVHLWPRQRIRSQEFTLAHMAPRRLKLMLSSMLEKAKATRSQPSEIVYAWERLVWTCISSTYASGKLFLTCRFLSSTLGNPSSPFHKMKSKLESPVNYADVVYLARLIRVLETWTQRDQFRARCPLLGVPRGFSQAEAYWMMWVPSEFADTNRNMMLCVLGLYDEMCDISASMEIRVKDLNAQLALLQSPSITMDELRASLQGSCTLDTDGKLGWSWIGSLASAHALHIRSSPDQFDRKYARGRTARNITDHLTVRHSARIDEHRVLRKGTVAEMILDSKLDDYLSAIMPTYRFLYVNRPVFFNHPKKGEHKEREISITDPDSRIMLSDAELICGMYGKTTMVDFLKDSAKNSKFYRTSSGILTRGGGIQSSDATRYGPSMSNFAIAIMLLGLGTISMHLRWASVVYARLAYRVMLLPTSILAKLNQYSAHSDMSARCNGATGWISKLPMICTEDGVPHVGYCTSHHMGQGMSHHSSSLLHAGGLIVAVDSASRCQVSINSVPVKFETTIMVTSDDSTILTEASVTRTGDVVTRLDKQRLARVFLQLVRAARDISLRMVSVKANLVKEIISGSKGEFNSQDTGIGETCPVLGFREMISLIVPPSASSLVGDYLNAHANARNIAFAGQGFGTGNFAHAILIDAIEERWGIVEPERDKLMTSAILPIQLLRGCHGSDLAASPASWLPAPIRASLLAISTRKNIQSEDLDPHVRDSVFAPLLHIKVSMSKQHRQALSKLKAHIAHLEAQNKPHQAQMLKESLRSTMQSARTRNLGRIAMRIRNRLLTPRDYLERTFDKDTVMNHTLNWLSYMEHEVGKYVPSEAEIDAGNKLSGFMRIMHRQNIAYPRPPRIKRFVPAKAVKPRYRDQGYGATPFGRHALARSGTATVPEIGDAERQNLQNYYALQNHRRFTEHIEYGGGFVSSWSALESCIIVALDISSDIRKQSLATITWGDFTQAGIQKLRQLAAEYRMPVLALHRHDGITGLWHCIHQGLSYTVMAKIDIELHQSDAIHHQLDTGQWVLLALQGRAESYDYENMAPTPGEIYRYQHAGDRESWPSMIRSLEDENVRKARIQCAAYSAFVSHNSETAFVYYAPEITGTFDTNPHLRRRAPQVRARNIAELCAAGYWHSSLRGSCFRAFLKGHFLQETIWTGGVLGWRSSSTNIPYYYDPNVLAGHVRSLIIVGGINDPDMLTPFNPDLFGSGHKVLSESNTYSFDNVVRLSSDWIPKIVSLNSGQRHGAGNLRPTFLDCQDNPNDIPAPEMSPEEARQALTEAAFGLADVQW